MSMPYSPEPNIVVVPAHSLPSQPWWKALHLTINTSFQNKISHAFPPSWTRLPSKSREAGEKLKEELGPGGLIAVILLVDRPIACAGALPFRGANWINNEKSADEDDDISGDVEVVNGEVTSCNSTCQQHEVVSTLPDQSALSDASEGDWEVCCLCIHPIHRRIGLSPKLLRTLIDHIKPLGAKRLMANYVIEETGYYWPHMGFEVIPGAGGVLRKGFTHQKGMEGLREDIHFAMGVKTL